jgi:hypothetical protein
VRNDFARVWAGGRGEYLGSSAFGETHKGFGAMGRLSAELYVGGAGVDPRGVFLERTRSASTSKPACATWSTTSARFKRARDSRSVRRS